MLDLRRVVLSSLVLLAACKSDPTRLLLAIASDLPSSLLSAVEIAVAEDPDAGFVEGGSSTACVCLQPGCASGPSLPLLVPLAPGQQGARAFMIEARAHGTADCSGTALLVEQAVTSFVEHEQLVVSMALNNVCLDKVPCGVGQTCDPDTGACISNVVTGTMPDLLPPPGVDQSVSPPDLGPSLTPFSLADAPDSWDIAANDTDFTIIMRHGTSIEYGSVGTNGSTTLSTRLASSTRGEVCAARIGTTASFLYGDLEATNTGGSITSFTGTSDSSPVALGKFNLLSELQCEAGVTGATISWLSISAQNGNQSQLVIVLDAGSPSASASSTGIATNTYRLSSTSSPQDIGFAYVPVEVSGSDTGAYVTYQSVGDAKADSTGLDATRSFAMADTSAHHRALVGTSGDAIVYGAPTPLVKLSGDPGALVAMVPAGPTLVAIATLPTTGQNAHAITLYAATTNDVPTPIAPGTSVVTTTADTAYTPVLAASATLLLVTWVDVNGKLMGRFFSTQ